MVLPGVAIGCRERQVRGAGGEFREAAVPRALAEVKGRLRMPAPERADEQRQHRLAEGVLERHGDPAANHFRFVPDNIQPRLEFGQGGLNVGQERLRRGSQPHAAAVPDQQFRPHDGAGTGDRPAHRRLRQAQELCGLGDVLRPPELCQQRQEGQQLHQLLVFYVHVPPHRTVPYLLSILWKSCIGSIPPAGLP